MSLWYNLPTKDSKFANLACSDWSSINSKFDIAELAIKQDDSFYYLFAQATELTDVKFVKGERNWEFLPQLVQFKVARKDYEKYSMDEKKQIPVKQSMPEKFYCKCFETLDLEKIYAGKIYFQNIPQIEMAMNGELTEDMVTVTIQSMCKLSIVELPQFLKLNELEIPTSGFKSYSKTETEEERLNAREAKLLKSLKLMFPELEFNSLADVFTHYNDEKITVQVQLGVEVIKLVLGNGN